MKRLTYLLMISFSAMALVACKKEEKKLVVSEDQSALSTSGLQPLAAEQIQADIVAEAKKLPLTTLAISENNFNFGDVKKGDHVEHTYTVTNTGDKPLVISTVKPGCGCTAPDYTKDPILPGQKGKVTLKFDSSSFEGLQNKYAEVYTNTEKSPVVLTFSANVLNK
ncbi:DUF1573 domain-containing protein [Elizabethkingia anophelis]|uniref:DUF1573 domain-containing protein n=1 Tax=Elizabethkingia anophelis TaxID=1117645 RepID=UPI000C6DB2EE|nr:DUF1573 domain-containing protein [Elizabethkingia anophelis]PKR33068.1 hypothetical protein CWH99_01015 [Elizabethkingia anophelis]PKR35408.1 hypothetical protein CWI00_12285 [Elizabethkingia anophelis]PRQ81095.1 hypothetical protein CMT60_03230 [Elizabethkingia anophelis]PRQ82543.1 hypothetical protein CMT87_17510 [Elizabethkingia anophelis]PRQ88949.1 hypothetical protein CMT86_00480 [Elizabethkingia anophelis]